MNCTKCGTILPEGSVFCPSCGSNLEVQPVIQQTYEQQPMMQQPTMQQPTMQQPMMQQPMMSGMAQPVYSPAPKKSKAPLIALGVSLFLIIAIIAIVVILLFSCSSNKINKSPTSVVTNCLTSVTDNDVDTFIQTVYPPMVKHYKSLGYSEDDIFEGLGGSLLGDESYEKFSNIKITSSEPLSSDELSESNEFLMNMDGYIEVSKLYQIEGTLNAKTDDDVENINFEAVVGYCEDDNYYIFEIYVD